MAMPIIKPSGTDRLPDFSTSAGKPFSFDEKEAGVVFAAIAARCDRHDAE
jgi:hypothetical protein